MRLAALAIMMVIAAVPALGGEASFDCSKAQSPSEKTICADDNADLALRDGVLARLYKALKEEGGHDALLAGQPAWLKERNACGADANCLRSQYDARLIALAKAAGDETGATGSYAFGRGTETDFGSAVLIREADGTLTGEINTVMGDGQHICEVEIAGAENFGDAWLWTDSGEPDDEGRTCRVLLRPGPKSLRIDSRSCSLYCGVQATLDEDYKRAK